jgi:outer membrane protein assembly factor BamB
VVQIKRTFIIVCVVLLFLLSCVVNRVASATVDWPMFGYDLGRTGYSSDALINPIATGLWWSYPLGSYVVSSPTVWGGYVFIGDNNGDVRSISYSTGTLIWSFHAAASVQSSPAIGYGNIYVGSGAGTGGKVYALDVYSGTQVWAYPSSGYVQCRSSPALHDDKVIVGVQAGTDGKVIALNPYDGSLIWQYPTTGGIGVMGFSSPVISNGRVMICSWDGYVYALDETTGTELWKTDLGYPAVGDCTPAVYESYLCVTADHGWVYFLDPNDGHVSNSMKYGDGRLNSPAISLSYIVFTSTDHKIYAIPLYGGSSWSYDTGSIMPLGKPAITGWGLPDTGYVYVGGGYSQKIFCLEITSGAKIFEYNTNGDVLPSPAVADDRVFFASSGAHLYCSKPGGPGGAAVGGFQVPVDKFGLLAPYIGLASTTMIGAVAMVAYIKRAKRRKEKQ